MVDVDSITKMNMKDIKELLNGLTHKELVEVNNHLQEKSSKGHPTISDKDSISCKNKME